MPPDPTRLEPLSLTYVEGGYVGFEPSFPLLLVSLVPYWRIVLTIAVAAIVLSWFVGRLFAQQALRPINEVSNSLRALADGDYTQRRFVMPGGDEVASLTAAFNDAAASVATAMDHRRHAEERMRQFAADASHELRTPLTVIAGYIDVLRRGAIEEPRIARQILAHDVDRERAHARADRPADAAGTARFRGAAAASKTSTSPSCCASQVEAARRLDDRRVIDYSVDGVETVARRSRRAGRSGLERHRKRAEVRSRRADPSARDAQQRPLDHHRARRRARDVGVGARARLRTLLPRRPARRDRRQRAWAWRSPSAPSSAPAATSPSTARRATEPPLPSRFSRFFTAPLQASGAGVPL